MSTGKKHSVTPRSEVTYDFLIRTAIERESSGKRKIRPKPLEDFGDFAEESDDPDYAISESPSASGDDSSSEDEQSDDENKEDSQNNSSVDQPDGDTKDQSSDNESEDDESSSEESSKKKSTLRETLERAQFDPPVLSKKRGRKKKVTTTAKKRGRKSKGKNSKESNEDSQEIPKKRGRKRKRSSSEQNRPINVDPSSTILGVLDSLSKCSRIARENIDINHLICAACLGTKSDASNEIVECDSCCITVHEGCYGVSDSCSGSSGSDSSWATEPWFCDACKQSDPSIACELCPVTGGLFKESPGGRWTHLVCALYTPGVYVDGFVNLVDISHSKWGAQICTACENEKYSRTGICIGCDAGFCKSYLHATCAQRKGLLSEPFADTSHSDEFPFYVSCKYHTSKETARRRADNFRIYQEQLRLKRQKKASADLTDTEKLIQARNLKKLQKIRAKVALKHSAANPLKKTGLENLTSVNGVLVNYKSSMREKKPRLLQTFSGAVQQHLRKADKMGLDIKALELEDKNEKIISNVKKKWNVLPSIGVEYSAYYVDRESRITKLKKQCELLNGTMTALQKEQETVADIYETYVVNKMAMSEDCEDKMKSLQKYKSLLKILLPGDKRLNAYLNQIAPPKPRSPSPKRNSESDRSKSPRIEEKKRGRGRVRKSTSPAGRLAIVKCSVCNESDDQHMITRCDKCKLNYHLRCLDPPLTRMPKKTRLFGWVCSDCCEKDSSTEDAEVDTEAPRTLRGRAKIKKPGKYRRLSEDEVNLGKATKKLKKPGRKRKDAGTKEQAKILHSSNQMNGHFKESSHGKLEPNLATSGMQMLTVSTSLLIDGVDNYDHPTQPSLYVPMEESKHMVNSKTHSSNSSSSDAGNYIQLHYVDNESGSNPTCNHNNNQLLETSSPIRNSSPPYGRGSIALCFKCLKEDNKKSQVACDKCKKWIHFMCLSPPLKYSPRRRGYSWYCSECDEEESVSPVSGVDTKAQENGIAL